MIAVRKHLVPSTVLFRNVLLSLGAVLAIVIGLLAMHSLNMGSDHAAGSTSSVASVAVVDAADHTHLGGQSGGSVVAGCAGTCGDGHGMAVMGCILALLVTTLMLAYRAIGVRPAVLLRPLDALRVSSATVRVPQPPSLYSLSISRT